MDDYRTIEIKIARKYGAIAKGTRKSIGDFLLNDDLQKPVNVKSNNIVKNNYSPNIISAKRLIKWVENEGNELYFLFVDYKKTDNGIEIIKESGLVPFYHLSWNCLRIEAQGWGVIQMPKPLEINSKQTKNYFLKGMKEAYEIYIKKETKKMIKINDMIKNF